MTQDNEQSAKLVCTSKICICTECGVQFSTEEIESVCGTCAKDRRIAELEQQLTELKAKYKIALGKLNKA